MENEKLKTENEVHDSTDENFSVINYQLLNKKICSACGTKARRENARFCFVCGKFLSEDYQPLDNIKASYRLQGKSFLIENTERKEFTDLFQRNKNEISQMAWACVVYSFVPYLGILFVPLAFVVGSFGYIVSRRQPHLGGRKLALVCIALSFVILIVQVFLWWLLYIIPELGKQI